MRKRGKFRRELDFALTPNILKEILERREFPDGSERVVTTTMRNGVPVNRYPWEQMIDGDFFYLNYEGRFIETVRAALKQGASREEIEIYIAHEPKRGPFWLRVTRIQGNMGLVRMAARSVDPTVNIGFDVEKRKRAIRAWRDKNKAGRKEPELLEPGTLNVMRDQIVEEKRRSLLGLEDDEVDYFA